MLKKKKGVMIIKKQIGRHLVYYSQRVRGDDGNWCKYHINCTIYGCWWCTDNVTDIFAVLAGIVLGSRLGAFSMFVYMMLGLVGAPIFAQFKGGTAVLFSPTIGFSLSFIIVA